MRSEWIGAALLAWLLAIAIIIGLAIYAAITKKPEPYEVWDKCENNGKYYVQVWMEVSPEDYIGLDIGDEYQIREKK